MDVKCEIAANTNVGRQRFRNEDNFIILEKFSLAIVADGMGGHVDGDVASRIVTETLNERYDSLYAEKVNDDDDQIKSQEQFLAESIECANFKIFEKNQGVFSLESMGTTVVGLQITPCGHSITACVGDSRIYRIRDEEIEQITEDHSLVGELLRHNIIHEKDLMFLQNKNIITRALGMGQNVTVDTKVHKLQNNDIFLLCTDGLSDLVENDPVLQIVLNSADLEETVANLIDAANDAGGSDNITVALVKVQCE
ncbi:Stp1/IreP family PP2C-type Ser/Thr phosphatase [Candidatus Uabimicrobium sp. HlEnr_7]|uniref:Stp1/IreP family PP2C-type Ser/Thr phosphatase n=1 Tax=Candidatus Uabimicrobium helgolandensis TaxID=3095367 RepID=UPI003555E644